MARIHLPANLRAHTGQQSTIELDAVTVSQLIDGLIERYPDIGPFLRGESGQLHPYVNLFVDQQSVRDLNEMDTPVGPHQTLLILTALSGG